ncbi:MAG: hypothetical protein NTV01_03665 [Bacteroidia bacterium]|nr:hypothetical protein [Bacteroidia bacterium]
MKPKFFYLIIAASALLLVSGHTASKSSCSCKVPESLTGTWTGKQKVTVRSHSHMKYSFCPAPDTGIFLT